MLSKPENKRPSKTSAAVWLGCLLAMLVALTPSVVSAANNPVPYIGGISPAAAAPGGGTFTVTVNGLNFISTSVVYWGGTALTTAFVSATKLTASVPSTLISATGAGWISVRTPTPGGGTSNVAFLQVNAGTATVGFANLTFAGGNAPVYAAQGDLNGDGKLDVVMTNYNDGTVSVYLGNGDGTFQPQQTIGVGGSSSLPVAIAIGDFNGDGKLDLAVGHDDPVGGVTILLGNGDGTFQTPQTISMSSAGDSTYGIVLGDFNGDGALDIAVTNYYFSTVTVLLGNGDGTFQTGVPYTTSANPSNSSFYVAEADLNGDGNLDLIASNEVDGTVVVMLGNGDGTFQTAVPYASGTTPEGIAIGDFNGDGNLDLMVADSGNTSLNLLLGNGNGTFQTAQTLAVGADTNTVAAGDVNGDGKLDVVATNSNSGLILLQGNGDGTFQTPNNLAGAGSAYAALLGPYNPSFGLGIAADDYTGNQLAVQLQSVTLAPTALSFGSQNAGSSSASQGVTITNTTVGAVTLSPVTITGASSGDFTLSSSCGSSLVPGASCSASVAYAPVGAGASTAALTFTDNAAGSPQSVPLTGTGVGHSAASLSSNSLTFTGQLVGSTSTSQSVTVTNTGNLTLNISSIALAGTNPGDFVESSTCGSSLAPNGACSVTVQFAPIATGTRSAAVTLTDDAGDSPQSISLTGTGIQAAGSLSGSSLTFTSQNMGTTSAPQSVTLNNTGSAPLTISSIATSGDFGETNNCGSSVAISTGCTIQVTFTPTAGGTRTGTLTITDSDPSSPQTVSLTGAGVVALSPIPFIGSITPIVVAPGGAQFTLTVNGAHFAANSTVSWNGTALTTTYVSAKQVTATVPAGLVAANATASVTVINAGPGGGTSNLAFFQVTPGNPVLSFANANFAGGSAPVYVAQGDLNGDGKLDVVMTNYNDGTISVYLGNGDGTFQAQKVVDVGGSSSVPVGVAIGDFNGDGKLDVVVGHDDPVGNLTILLGNGDGTFQAPQTVSAGDATYAIVTGDFNGDGKLDIAVTNYYASTVSVLLGNGDGSFQTAVPYSVSSNPSNTVFYVTEADLNGDGNLDLIASNEVDGTIAVLLGNSDGTFQAATPFTVGAGPEGMAIGDFNGDGKLDLVAASSGGNSLLLLLGNGNGSFQAPESLSVGANTEAVAAGDLNGDGKLDVVATNANAGLILLLGNGDGTFQTPTPLQGAGSAYAALLGPYNANFGLGIAANDYNGNQLAVQLQTITVSPASLTFSSQNVGTTSSPQTVTITNTTVANLTLSPISITGTNSGDFLQSGNCSGTLVPGASCTINVTYSPLAGGSSSASLSIGNNAPGAPQSIPLSGTSVAISGTSLSSSSLVFTGVTVGTTSASQSVTLTNTGHATLNISSIALTGTNSGDFSQTNTCGATVAVNANCSINVTFSPSASGARSASVSITDDAPGSPQAITLTGNGLAATATLSAPTLAFGNQNVATTSASQSVTLSNTGNTALAVTSIAVTGANSGDFAQTNTCGVSVAAGGNCSITVTFTPTAIGVRNASVSITDSAPASPQSVGLSGTGLASTVSLSASSLVFAAEPTGTTSAAQSVTLTNTGNAALAVTSIAVTGGNTGDFNQTNNCGVSVAAAATCTINVTFTPAAIGNRSAAIAITDSAASSPQGISLTGIGQGASVSLSSSSVTFSGQAVGTTSAAQSVTLTNTGNVALPITSIAVSGANGGDFGQTNNCGASLAAAAICSVSITFTPTAGGARSAAVTITDSAASSPQVISLQGTGQDFSLTLSAPQVVMSSGSTNLQATLTSVGGFSQSVTLSCTGAPQLATCAIAPTAVTPTVSGAAATVTVTLTAGAASLPRHTPLPGGSPLLSFRLLGCLAALLLMAFAISRFQGSPIRRMRTSTALFAGTLLLAAAGLTACSNSSGGFGAGPTPGTYTLHVTGTSGSITHSASFTLTVQ
jgi:hypothetical protein